MDKKEKIHNLKLQQCCRDSLKEIDDKIKPGKLLRAFCVLSPFIKMIENPIGTLFTVIETDWDNLIRATKDVSRIVRNRCYHIAVFEYLNHPGGPLNRFWKEMSDVYS